MIDLSGQNLELRRDLELEGYDENKHVERVNRVSERYGIDIKFRGSDINFTCAVFAFGLFRHEEYTNIASSWEGEFGDIFCGKRFVEWITENFLEETVCPGYGDFICYYNELGNWMHIGIYNDANKVLSKWGTNPLYLHEISHVPINYGVNVRFFKKIESNDCMAIFKKWAEKNKR